MSDTRLQRERMVQRQIAARGVRDHYTLEAMRKVPREEFVARPLREFAYEDSPLPIEAGQTISQPYIVALMIAQARIRPGERVLEVGAGSGYAAAVMSTIAGRVYAIERVAELATLARERFSRLGYDNIEVRTGDGTRGWPEAAPFDAIIAAAGGPDVPEILLQQLAPGGRLVMPIGSSRDQQRLVLVTRTGNEQFVQKELGDVRFVPLIGEHGWRDDAPVTMAEPQPRMRSADAGTSIHGLIRAAAEPLPDLDDPAFGAMFDRFAQARVVLLGEASHGTSEFHRARAAITRRLVEEHGFRIIAVEADWPDAASIDRYVRGKPPLPNAEPAFQRFPTWMWRNSDVDRFVGWLREHNQGLPHAKQAGFHGLDLYSMNASIHAVIDYLDRTDPDAARIARRRYACLTPWSKEPAEYGHMAVSSGYAFCEDAVADILKLLLSRRVDDMPEDAGADLFDAAQNARLVQDAEAYYRAMYYGSAESWNLRDAHMFRTLQHLLDAGGTESRAVVWAHNSHIGDARFTEMGQQREELNLGQLCRQQFGDTAVLIGFGTDSGTVAAASNWDEPMEVMRVKPSMDGSYERMFHDAGVDRCLVDLRSGQHPDLRQRLGESQLERFIGVVYRPQTERWSHYTDAELSRQFDAYVWFDQTRAVTPLGEEHAQGVPDTWPFGL